jgi:hypothetical protein
MRFNSEITFVFKMTDLLAADVIIYSGSAGAILSPSKIPPGAVFRVIDNESLATMYQRPSLVFADEWTLPAAKCSECDGPLHMGTWICWHCMAFLHPDEERKEIE